jgi:nucleoside-diphosphate-sugar epimerase
MKVHLVTGACGFVGRNLVKRLLSTTTDILVIVDDLSTGTAPQTWLPSNELDEKKGGNWIGERVLYFNQDCRKFFQRWYDNPEWMKSYGLDRVVFDDVFHFAAIVGGRSKIEGDPMMVALDLAIDAEFFYWVTRFKPTRALFPSSSAAYPIDLQTDSAAIALAESDINFAKMGQPDMTYGWSKLTGEFLAQVAARNYGISVACVRPFSGYGEDQDLSYPTPAIAARAARKENPFEVWGTGYQGRDFVHIDDCIDCILMALDNIHDGSAINIGMGKLTSFRELIEIFTGFAGYKPEIKALTDKPMGVHSRYSNMDYVHNTFGWRAKISIEEGMRRVYDAALERIRQGA